MFTTKSMHKRAKARKVAKAKQRRAAARSRAFQTTSTIVEVAGLIGTVISIIGAVLDWAAARAEAKAEARAQEEAAPLNQQQVDRMRQVIRDADVAEAIGNRRQKRAARLARAEAERALALLLAGQPGYGPYVANAVTHAFDMSAGWAERAA